MFKDFKIFLGDNQLEYEYKLKNNEIIIYLSLNSDSNLEIFYDDNVYEKVSCDNVTLKRIKSEKLYIDMKNTFITKLELNVQINYKYFVKTVYKYLNTMLDKELLLKELEIFKNSIIGKQYAKEIEDLITQIDLPLEDIILNSNDEYKRIIDILINSNLYINFAKQMTSKDLMLLITYYISCEKVPHINQDLFNDLVSSAIESDYPLESVWRLAMNYDQRGYNFDLIDNYFIEQRDVWYFSEYFCGVLQIDYEKLIDMVIDTKDKQFIKGILEDNLMQQELTDEQTLKLKEELK